MADITVSPPGFIHVIKSRTEFLMICDRRVTWDCYICIGKYAIWIKPCLFIDGK